MCKQEETKCIVEVSCTKCLISSGSSIDVILNGPQMQANYVKIQVKTTSSIPNESSESTIVLKPDFNHIFKGNNPTIIEILLYPSAYNFKEEDQESTGYHSTFQEGTIKQKSQYRTDEAWYKSNLVVQVQFKVSDLGLYTVRFYKQTPLELVCLILGSIIGVLVFAGFTMRYIEPLVGVKLFGIENQQPKVAYTKVNQEPRKSEEIYIQGISQENAETEDLREQIKEKQKEVIQENKINLQFQKSSQKIRSQDQDSNRSQSISSHSKDKSSRSLKSIQEEEKEKSLSQESQEEENQKKIENQEKEESEINKSKPTTQRIESIRNQFSSARIGSEEGEEAGLSDMVGKYKGLEKQALE